MFLDPGLSESGHKVRFPVARYHHCRSEQKKRNEAAPPTEGQGQEGKLNMSDAVSRVSVEIEGKEISFETGKLAK